MKALGFISLLSTLSLLACSGQKSPSQPPAVESQPVVANGAEIRTPNPYKWSFQGVNLISGFGHHLGGDMAREKMLRARNELSANTIGIRRYVEMPHFDRPELKENVFGDDLEIERQINLNKSLGFKSVLNITIHVPERARAPQDLKSSTGGCSDGGFWQPWHGAVDLDGPQAYNQWFESYERILLDYVDLIRDVGGVSIFSVGNELSSLTTTRPLNDLASQNDFYETLKWAVKSQDPELRKYAQETTIHLFRFDIFFPHVKGVKDEPHYEWEIQNWISQRDVIDLSPAAKKQLFYLENQKRGFLNRKWILLLAKVRGALNEIPQKERPLLSYNGNSDTVTQVGFLESLDIISVSAYFRLSRLDKNGYPIVRTQSVRDIKQGWRRAAGQLEQMYEGLHQKKKIIFSEIGFTNQEYTSLHPWAFAACQPVIMPGKKNPETILPSQVKLNFQERANAIDALHAVVREGKMPWLDGILIWNIFTSDGDQGDPYTLFAASSQGGDYSYENAIKDLFNDTFRDPALEIK